MISNKVYPIDNIGYVQLVDKSGVDAALKVVNAARTSYGKNKSTVDEKDKKLISYLWKHEHTSPFRHTYYTFLIKAPLFVFRQWVKYQVGSTWRTYTVDGQEVTVECWDQFFDTDKGCSWNELSGRYKELEPEFFIPKEFRKNAPSGSKQKSIPIEQGEHFHNSWNYIFYKSSQKAYKVYQEAIDNGICREQARMLLPQNIYTMSYWTASLQAILHFFSQRLSEDAQYEIRQYATAIKQLLQEDLDILSIHI